MEDFPCPSEGVPPDEHVGALCRETASIVVADHDALLRAHHSNILVPAARHETGGGAFQHLMGLLRVVSTHALTCDVLAVCWHTMKRTTVKLTDELDARLRHEADRRGTTVSEITREAIESHLGTGQRRLMAAKAGRSGRKDTARRIEEILRREARRSR